jgi:hypothetical protein
LYFFAGVSDGSVQAVISSTVVSDPEPSCCCCLLLLTMAASFAAGLPLVDLSDLSDVIGDSCGSDQVYRWLLGLNEDLSGRTILDFNVGSLITACNTNVPIVRYQFRRFKNPTVDVSICYCTASLVRLILTV